MKPPRDHDQADLHRSDPTIHLDRPSTPEPDDSADWFFAGFGQPRRPDERPEERADERPDGPARVPADDRGAARLAEPPPGADRPRRAARPRREGLRPRLAHAVVATRLFDAAGARSKVLGLAVVAVVLVGASYGVGRMLAGSESLGTAGAEAATVPDRPMPYDGPVQALAVTGSSASCQSAGSNDAAGNPVTYEPAKAHDADLSTAWRCDGSGKGVRLTLDLAQETEVAEVGLVPGYAKTDPANGVDRYAENNRITRVRWHFDDGTSVVQRFRPDPADRSMRTTRVPATRTGTVEIEILRSARGPRNTVAISEIRLAGPDGS